ncbi:zinc ribbon domain-containing protein [Ornithinimicrobium flavum]|uniref:zinc ribbon domain-containing protein n=1 Tax=Ornithinimicrobium flavum TaxID=1288636 RepID=UPI00106FD4EA|nr:zinc ribbon domain-containing protein [Ornithinimicrobium flavum]
MTDEPCTVCGERNPGRAQFCTFCGAYLGWDDEDEPTGLVLLDEPVAERVRHEPVPPSSPEGGAQEEAAAGESGKDAGLPRFPVPQHARAGYDRTRPRPPQDRPRAQPQDPTTVFRLPGRPGPEDEEDLDRGLQAQALGAEVVVTPGGPPAAAAVRVVNTSTIVQAYDVTVVNAPPWLVVVDGRVELLPGADEQVLVHLSIRPEDLVPVQRARLRLRVQAESALELRRDVGVDLVVGAVAAPPQLRLEPSTLRARDSTTALFRVIVDNRRSNEVRRVHLTGSDPELAARFGFTPEHLEVPPGGAVAARLRVDAPLPEPGEQLTRTLNVVAVDGRSEYEARATFVQTSSAPVVDPPVSVRLDPSVVRVKDGAVGHATVVLDNRAGTRPQWVELSVDDDEGVVRFSLSADRVEVPPGRTEGVHLTMTAPRPDVGQTCTRLVTVAVWNGETVREADGTFEQAGSDRRPVIRAVLTVLGAVAMVLGSVLPWTTVPPPTGIGWTYDALVTHFTPFDDLWVNGRGGPAPSSRSKDCSRRSTPSSGQGGSASCSPCWSSSA